MRHPFNRINNMNAAQTQVNAGRLSFTEGNVVLYQNSPNPFIEMTLLWFRIPAAMDVALRIFDAKGREVYSKAGHYAAGENHIVIHRSDLRDPGFFSARLETPIGIATRKMMMY